MLLAHGSTVSGADGLHPSALRGRTLREDGDCHGCSSAFALKNAERTTPFLVIDKRLGSEYAPL
jgi:hypothetical protein